MKLCAVAGSAMAFVMLASCGGGGAPAQAPTNRGPVFTSAAAVSIKENATAAYQAMATDSDHDALTFSIDGGDDAARFIITSNGALSFVSPPNFDAPADADGDNVYLVRLKVSDGKQAATLALRVSVINDREGVGVRRVATGFDHPIAVLPDPDGRGKVLVAQQNGAIYELDVASGTKSLYLTVPEVAKSGGRILDIKLEPLQLPTDARVYQSYVLRSDAAGNVIVDIGLAELHPLSFYSTSFSLNIPHGSSNIARGGWVQVGPDGDLYAAIDDGGDPDAAQDIASRRGKILHIIKNPDPGTSGVYFEAAPDNPFSSTGGDPYVFSYGLHTPIGSSLYDGALIFGDRGDRLAEEIDRVDVTQNAGANLGWPFREGTQVRDAAAPSGLADPVAQYLHGDTANEGSAVVGGYVYQGSIASLAGDYVFADAGKGSIWAIQSDLLAQGSIVSPAMIENRTEDFAPDAGSIGTIAAFGEDSEHYLFIIDDDGEIFKVTSN